MALYILNKSGGEKIWHVGNKALTRDQILETVYIQADGDELERIQTTFRHFGEGYTIPMPNERVVLWSGDIAITILLNLF